MRLPCSVVGVVLLAAALFAGPLESAEGFSAPRFSDGGPVRGARRRATELRMSLKDMARKAKITEIQTAKSELQASDPNNPVFKFLEEGKSDQLPAERPSLLYSSLKKFRGNLTVIAEYRRKMKSGFIKEPLEPNLLSPLYRTGGAAAVVVATDKATGGCSSDDVTAVVTEQSKAAGDYPGPLPCIIRDLIVDEFQVASAKALGAQGITLNQGLLGTDRLRELLQFAESLDLECFVQVTNEEEISEALAAGSRMLVAVGKQPTDALELKKHIPDDILAVVEVQRRSDEGLEEVEDCWALRDEGFNSVWVCEILYKAGQTQAENVSAIIKAVRAKASVKYGRARGMSGKGEGAKEYLGYLEM